MQPRESVGVGEIPGEGAKGHVPERRWITVREQAASRGVRGLREGKALKEKAHERLRHEIRSQSSSMLETAEGLRAPESGTGTVVTNRPVRG